MNPPKNDKAAVRGLTQLPGANPTKNNNLPEPEHHIKLNTVFKIKGNDLTLYLERAAHSDGRILCVVFLPENVVSNVPDNGFDARVYKSIKKNGIEYVSKATFMEIWEKRSGKYSIYEELPDWVQFGDGNDTP